jgi:acetyl-CoA carboxylase biotin carboxyl carrier protein
MKIEDIKTIVKLMSENDLSEFTIKAEDMHLSIKRGSSGHSLGPAPVIAHPAPPPAPAAPQIPAGAPEKKEDKSAKPAAPAASIDSPIVGTFYRSPSPDAPPFIKVGDKVTPETVVCIIEAMKVMNEIKAEKSGVIKEICADNATPVEFGQRLFVLE